MSKRQLVDETIGVPAPIGQTVTDNWHTGYGSTGIKAAGALHRLLYGNVRSCRCDALQKRAIR
jgi:hypothetical protein